MGNSQSSDIKYQIYGLFGAGAGAAAVGLLHRRGAGKLAFMLTTLTSIGFGAAASLLLFSQRDMTSSSQQRSAEIASPTPSSSPDGAWMSSFVQELWPRISLYLKNLVETSIEPAINNALPSMMKGHVSFTEVTLGDSSPDFGPLTILKGEAGAIKLRIGMNLVSNLNIGLKAMGVYVGVSKLKLKGMLQIVFTPPATAPPFFGGLQIYFLNPPNVDLEFHGAAKVAACPSIHSILRTTISDLLAGIVVLPNMIAVDMNTEDSKDAVDLKYPEPIGVLQLNLLKGEELLACDGGVITKPSSDPYVETKFGCTTWTSPVIKNTLNPEWGEGGKGITRNFFVHSLSQVASFSVLDEDFTGSDLIGKAVEVGLDKISSGAPCSLELSSDKGASAGRLIISGKMLKPAPGDAPAGSAALISAKILEITGLAGDAQVPYKVCVSVGSESVSSSGSFAKAPDAYDAVVQNVCACMKKQGQDANSISKTLGIEKLKVDAYLSKEDPTNQSLKQRVQSTLDKSAATNPQLQQIIRIAVMDVSDKSCEVQV